MLLLACFLALKSHGQETPADFPEGKEGLRQLATYLATRDFENRERMSGLLWPAATDYALVFEPTAIAGMMKYHKKVKRNYRILVQPMLRTQLEIRIWQATRHEIEQHAGEGAFFAGGYVELATMLRPDVTFYRLKFAEPDRYLGSTYDLFVYLHGQWVFFPKPYQYLLKKN